MLLYHSNIAFKKFNYKNKNFFFFNNFELVVAELKANSIDHINEINNKLNIFSKKKI